MCMKLCLLVISLAILQYSKSDKPPLDSQSNHVEKDKISDESNLTETYGQAFNQYYSLKDPDSNSERPDSHDSEYPPIQQQPTEEPHPPIHPVSAHYTYSPLHLVRFAKAEREIYEAFGTYQEVLEDRLHAIRRFRSDYEESALKVSNLNPAQDEWQQAAFLTFHPHQVFRMIRRLYVDLRQFYEKFDKGHDMDIYSFVDSLRHGHTWPNDHDYNLASDVLLRLKDVYDLDAESFASGDLNFIQTTTGLNAKHCLEMADYALGYEDSLTAGEWLKAAWTKMELQGDVSASVNDYTYLWENTVAMHSNNHGIEGITNFDVFVERRKILRHEFETKKLKRTEENRLINYNALCRGDQLLTEVEKSKLYCYFETKTNPRFLIDPQRVEIHNLNPRIIEIHNFLGLQLTQDLISFAYNPLMNAANYEAPHSSGFLTSSTTAPAWIYEKSPKMYEIERKFEAILGLEIVKYGASQPFQISAFAVGGHQQPFIPLEEDEFVKAFMGERLATLQLVLEDDIVAGGDTVFPKLGISIRPNKGSAIIFFNLVNNGEINEDLAYGTCPVLLGHHWIASKFVHVNENIFKWKCHLDSQSLANFSDVIHGLK